MYNDAKHAYEAGDKATGSNRKLEATALLKMARLLEEAKRSWSTPSGRSMLVEALRKNQRLWTLFQTELAQPDHEMPSDLRVDLLKLSAFVDRRTFEVMARPEPEGVQVLIDINRQIALGLAATPS